LNLIVRGLLEVLEPDGLILKLVLFLLFPWLPLLSLFTTTTLLSEHVARRGASRLSVVLSLVSLVLLLVLFLINRFLRGGIRRGGRMLGRGNIIQVIIFLLKIN
jgi:hypothetical protein